MTVRWTVRADGDQGAQFAPRPSPIRVAILYIPPIRRLDIFNLIATCGFSSFGRAPPCQGGGGGFEPRNPLQKKNRTPVVRFFFWNPTYGASPHSRSPVHFCVAYLHLVASARSARNVGHRFTEKHSQCFSPRSPPKNRESAFIAKTRIPKCEALVIRSMQRGSLPSAFAFVLIER